MRFLLASVALDNVTAAEAVAIKWNQIFNDLFTNGLFGAITQACLAIALLFFCISVTQAIVASQDDNSENAPTKFLKKILTSALLIILLIGNGNMLTVGIKGFRAISNSVDKQILVKLQMAQNVNKRIADIRGQQETLKDIQTKAQTCKLAVDPIVAKKCADELNQQIVDAEASGKITDSKSLNAFIAYKANLLAAAGDPVATFAALEKPLDDAISGVVNDAVTSVFSYVLGLLTSAVQTMTELCFMLTSLVTPIFVTAGLLPGGSRSIIAILTSFWGVALYKVCYIIIVGLAAQMIADNSSGSALELGMITGIFAPILAGILAAGGGMGFAKAAASAAGSAASVISGGILKL